MTWSPLRAVCRCAPLFALVALLPHASQAAIFNGNIIDINRASGVDLTPGSYHNYDPTYGGSIRGGEFRVTAPPTGTIIERFKTFCLEYNEHITLGGDYLVTINEGAIQGGLSGATGGIDPISNATKYFYTAYRSNGLSGIGGFAYDNHESGDALQLLFWRLEGEVSDTLWAKFGSTTLLGNAAIRQKATDLWNYYIDDDNRAVIDAFTSAKVKVLNLWKETATLDYGLLDTSAAYRTSSYVSNVKRQSQLYLFSDPPGQNEIPEPATFAVWSILAAIGLVVVRRRRA